MFVGTYWFRRGDDGEWHACREDTSTAMCGEVQIRHNLDETKAHIAQIPEGQPIHDLCARMYREAERG